MQHEKLTKEKNNNGVCTIIIKIKNQKSKIDKMLGLLKQTKQYENKCLNFFRQEFIFINIILYYVYMTNV